MGRTLKIIYFGQAQYNIAVCAIGVVKKILLCSSKDNHRIIVFISCGAGLWKGPPYVRLISTGTPQAAEEKTMENTCKTAKKPGLWKRLGLRSRLLLVMLGTALSTLLVCIVLVLFLLQGLLSFSTRNTGEILEQYHTLTQDYFYQTELYVSNTVLGVYHSTLLGLIEQPGFSAAAANWQRLLEDTLSQYEEQLYYAPTEDAAYFIAWNGEVVAADSLDPASLQAQLDVFYAESAAQGTIYHQEGDPLTAAGRMAQYESDLLYLAAPGHESILAWQALGNGLCIGHFSFTGQPPYAVQALRSLADEHTALAAQSTGAILWQYVGWTALVVLLLALALVLISRRMAQSIVAPVEQRQRQQEDALAQAATEKRALEELNRLKTEFLGNVSHELKTPLTVISGYSQLARQNLEDTPGRQEADTKMQFIAAEAERLSLMVSQVLDMTRIEEGRMHWDFTPQHLDGVIHAAVQSYFPILNKNNNRLKIEIQDDLPLVRIDAARITQVLVNLIANAIEHTQNGLIEITAASLPSGLVEVAVADNGEGMSPAFIAGVFERYTTKTATGTGLGLSICKSIVQAHGGTIHAQSAPGRGTRVQFTLPPAACGAANP